MTVTVAAILEGVPWQQYMIEGVLEGIPWQQYMIEGVETHLNHSFFKKYNHTSELLSAQWRNAIQMSFRCFEIVCCLGLTVLKRFFKKVNKINKENTFH